MFLQKSYRKYGIEISSRPHFVFWKCNYNENLLFLKIYYEVWASGLQLSFNIFDSLQLGIKWKQIVKNFRLLIPRCVQFWKGFFLEKSRGMVFHHILWMTFQEKCFSKCLSRYRKSLKAIFFAKIPCQGILENFLSFHWSCRCVLLPATVEDIWSVKY